MKKFVKSLILTALMLISALLVFAACGGEKEDVTEAVTYTVSFYDADTLLKTEKVEAGKTISPPTLGENNGYRFGGWFIDGDEEKPFTGATAVESDLNVYAQWQRIVHVTFDLAGGTGTAIEIETYAGASITLPGEDGFAKGEEGLYAWSDGVTQYAPGAEYAVGTTDVIFAASWSTRYTMTFELGKNVQGEAPAPHTSTRGVILPDGTNFAKTGYEFAGWFEGTALHAAGEYYPLTKDVTLTAAFAGDYTLTLDTQGGTLENETVVRRTGEMYTLPEPTYTGYKFMGWRDGDFILDAGDEFAFGYEDVTLVAEWSDVFTISYKDWDQSTFCTQEVLHNTLLPAPGAAYALMEAEEFTGWKDVQGNVYTVDVTPITADVTLYAQYANYTTYNANDFTFVAMSDGNGYLIEGVSQSFLGAKTELYFPATFRGKPVRGTADLNSTAPSGSLLSGTSVGSSVNSLQRVVIPSTWTVIGNSTFTNSRLIREFDIRGKLERIGRYGFYYCCSITGFKIPATLRELDSTSFSACAKLENFEIDPGNTNFSVQDGVLFNADKTELLCYNFGNARTSYEVPASVRTVAENAFDHRGNYYTSGESNEAYHLTGAITFGEGSELTTVCTYAFGYVLCSVTFPASLRTIEPEAFYAATGEITFSEGLTELGTDAFRGYRGTRIALPATLEIMAEGCVRGASNLGSVTFPSGCNVTEIGDYAFTDSNKLTTYPFNDAPKLKTIGVYAFSTTGDSSATHYTGEVKFPASLVSIGEYAFSKNVGITSVTFASSDSLTSIGTGAFGECVSLQTVTFGDAPNLGDIPPLCFYLCSKLTGVTLPEGVHRIGAQAFAGKLRLADEGGYLSVPLQSIRIPASVQLIAGGAFDYCTELQSVTFGEGGSKLEIGQAFTHCYKLKSFHIPAHTTKMYSRTFEGATTLTTFTSASAAYPVENGGLYEAESNTLMYGCPDSVTGIFTARNGTVTIGEYAFAYNNALRELHLPASVKRIETHACYQAYSLVKVTQEEGGAVQYVGASAFSGYPATTDENQMVPLAEFPFREGLEELGTSAFASNKGFTEITVPASYTKTVDDAGSNTGGYAFSDCVYLTKLTFSTGSKLEEIPTAFCAGDIRLEEVVIEGDTNIQYLGRIMFSRCRDFARPERPGRLVILADHVVRGSQGTFAGSNTGSDPYTMNVEVFVPDNLVERYQLNGTWKNFSLTTIAFRPYSEYGAE